MRYNSGNPIEVTKNSNNVNKNVNKIRNLGYFDKNILCEECDNKFGKHENYFIKFLKNPRLNTYNYKSIILTILWSLWKACITNHKAFVVYSEEYANELHKNLKKVLNDLDITPLKKFPIWIKKYQNLALSTDNSNKDVLLNNIMPAIKGIDMWHGTLYRFDLMGYQIIIRIGGNSLPISVNKYITEDKANIIIIPYIFYNKDANNIGVKEAFDNFEII